MKTVAFFFTLILCMIVSTVTAQNTTRGIKTQNHVSIPNFNFTKALSMKENNKAAEVAFAEEAKPVSKSHTTINTMKTENAPSVTENTRVCQSQPINIRKTVSVQY